MTPPMTPEQEEQVRRALAAAARADDQSQQRADPAVLPDAVAARLDDVLAELVQGRRQAGVPHQDPDELDRHRSRRRVNVLVAAAAVAAIVAAGGTVVTGGFGGLSRTSDTRATSESAAGKAQDQAVPRPESAAPSAPFSATAPSAAGSGGASSPSPSARALAGLPALRSDTLAADVRRVVRTSSATPNSLQDRTSCRRPAVPRGADASDVRLDGEPATLVVDRATGGTRAARVYSCSDGTTPVATTTVPTR